MIHYHCPQKDANGCAIAALAMLTNMKYEKIFQLCKLQRKPIIDDWYGSIYDFYPQRLEQYIKHLSRVGFKFRNKKQNVRMNQYVSDDVIHYFKALKNDVLIEIDYEPEAEYTHCVVFCHKTQRIFDPSQSGVETLQNYARFAGIYSIVSYTQLISKP